MNTYRLRSEEFVKVKNRLVRSLLLQNFFSAAFPITLSVVVWSFNGMWQVPVLVSIVAVLGVVRLLRNVSPKNVKEIWDTYELSISPVEVQFFQAPLKKPITITKKQVKKIMLTEHGDILLSTKLIQYPHFVIPKTIERYDEVLKNLLVFSGEQQPASTSSTRLGLRNIIVYLVALLVSALIIITPFVENYTLKSILSILWAPAVIWGLLIARKVHTSRLTKLFYKLIAWLLACGIVWAIILRLVFSNLFVVGH